VKTTGEFGARRGVVDELEEELVPLLTQVEPWVGSQQSYFFRSEVGR
jgi:hypothetical protein